MSAPLFTQEAWSINEWPQGDASIRIGAPGTPVIAVVPLRDVSINEQKANAKLIAAAPDLVRVVQALVIYLEAGYDNAELGFLVRRDITERAQAARTKAGVA